MISKATLQKILGSFSLKRKTNPSMKSRKKNMLNKQTQTREEEKKTNTTKQQMAGSNAYLSKNNYEF